MKNETCGCDAFSQLHPVINFIYFCLVLVITMFVSNPVYQIISAAGAAVYYHMLKKGQEEKIRPAIMILLFFLTSVLNPLFNHEGATILMYLPSGNPVTLESLLYGLGAGIMMVAVIIWFACITTVFTSDKFVYLFGRMIPSLSLVLSMSLRFIPLFFTRMKEISDAQKCIGRDVSQGDVPVRIKNGTKILSALISWSMENAIETADSMNCRGYGLEGRTAFSIYRWDARDAAVLVWIIFAGVMTVAGAVRGYTYWRYYPTVKGAEQDVNTIVFEAVFLLLCITPYIIDKYSNAVIADMIDINAE